jgi:hypothetical protein
MESGHIEAPDLTRLGPFYEGRTQDFTEAFGRLETASRGDIAGFESRGSAEEGSELVPVHSENVDSERASSRERAVSPLTPGDVAYSVLSEYLLRHDWEAVRSLADAFSRSMDARIGPSSASDHEVRHAIGQFFEDHPRLEESESDSE